ncbi:hypothetical protein SAMN06265795_12261 [Noviherbaspirillum humi]|uniref:Uncharacterized protein n=2 Tax=Noviherbaspirillum humi TaxID=1688639 RepID=A0A239LF24_9BURK|nr:hypothetical protein SAMN06265795_12261 [Noviherbaspirillum humi]
MRAGNYVEETTTAIAGASGNGAVTLTAIANTPRFSTVLGTGATTVRYVIEDTVNKKFESGIGTVAANVLTRSRPQITWDGATYKDASSSVAALAFGSTPASGNIKIRMAPLAEIAGALKPGRQQITDADNLWALYPISEHMQAGSNGSARTFYPNIEYYAGYKMSTAGLLTGIRIDLRTTSGAGTLKWALYDVGHNGLPNNKLVTFNNVNLSATGLKTDTAVASWAPANGIWLPPGWYVIGMICDVQIDLGGNTNNIDSLYCRSNGYGYGDTLRVAGSFASGLPATPSLSGASMNDPGASGHGNAWIGLKVIA